MFCLLLCGEAAASPQSGYYEIVARHSGKCLDVEGESQAAGARVLQWDCGGWTNQQWQVIEVGGGYYKIVARHSRKVLDVQGGGLTNGTPVWQWDENGTAAQQWQIIDVGGGYSRIMARHSGKALDVSGASISTGAQIHQWDYVGGTNQQWLLRPLTYFEIAARHSGKCLDVEAESLASGARVLQWDCGGWANQQWSLIPVGGYYKVVARHSGKLLEVQSGGLTNGTPVWQWDENGGAAQQWQIIDVGGGYFRLMARHSGKALDVSGASTATGAQIHQWDYVGGANQQWRLYPVSAGADGRSQSGEWSAPTRWPFVAIHTTLLPNSKVLAWSRDKDVNGNDVAFSTQAQVWDPATNSFTPVTNSRTNMFCSGHTALPDGRLLVTGGHNLQDNVGLPHTNIFRYNDAANPWAAGPDMMGGRWYPTNTTLANGEVLVVTGDTGAGRNTIPQVWQTNLANPAAETWRTLPSHDFVLYPWMHVSPRDGRVFNSGPDSSSNGYLNPTTGEWTPGPPNSGGYRDAGTSVMFDTGRILVLGGGDPPTNTAQTINLNNLSPSWQTVSSMAYARRHVNGTVLPDGTVLVTGGTSMGGNNEAGAVYPAELWNPVATPQWKTLASMRIPRLYHSTALLLPDGRVLVTGGGFGGGGNPYYEVEIFSPPYLFKGARPTITSAPASVGYNQAFTIATPNGPSINKVRLIRLSSVTHSFNQDQRLTTLTISSTTSSGVNVTSPASGRISPPGYYLLFIVNTNGVPSEGRMIRIG